MISKLNSIIDKKDKDICFRILLYSFILKLFYSLLMQYDISAHDLWDPSDWNNITTGSLGYIQYIYQHLALPPYMEGQFYHPPLYYAFSALIMALTYGPLKDLDLAFDVIQSVTMVLAFLVTYVSYKLFIELGIKGHKLVYSTLLICACPTLVNMGACINNDCLMTLFCVLVIFYAVKWSKNYNWIDIILMALTLALGMLSKTSAVLLAPALGILFIYTLYKNRENKSILKKVVLQYVAFAFISIPLGMSYLIRNYIMFKMPFNYVMPLIDVEPFDVSLWNRIGLPSIQQMTTPITDFDDVLHFSNIWGQLVQSFLFDEMIFNTDIPGMYVLSVVLIWITYVLFALLIFQFIRLLMSKRLTIENKILMTIAYLTLFISFMVFCFQYKFICTMHMRYIFLTVIILIAGYGLAPDLKSEKNSKLINSIETVVIVLFSFISIILYLIPVKLSF